MSQRPYQDPRGPFRADQIKDGDPYELSGGHPIYCTPAGPEHAGRNLSGGGVLDTDPAVDWAGVDAGFSPEPDLLRAPDIAVAPPAMVASHRGWIPGAPPLAVEYASHGQDETALQAKIADLLGQGTRMVWVVRLVGPRRVEVYRPGEPMRVAGPGEQLLAPGVLRNPVPVEALYDRDAAHDATFRNLLQRRGYEDLDQVRDEGRELGLEQGRDQGREQGMAQGLEQGLSLGRAEGQAAGVCQGLAMGILALLAARGIPVSEATERRIRGSTDAAELHTWLLAAARIDQAEQIFAG